MRIKIGAAVSLSRPDSWKISPDDRQSIIETDGGNVVQDYGHIASGDKISLSATFYKEEFQKLWQYFHARTIVDMIDHNGIIWQGMRVRVISYGYEERFENYINCELELWRI